MLYRKMPKNGEALSILGFGCMRLPVNADYSIDEARAKEQLRNAIDKGVTYVDTAWPYHAGESEPFVGRALTDEYREKVRIATKLPTWMIKTREDMDIYLNQQLERLQTDQIDYYLIHTLAGESWDKMIKLGVADFLDTAKADGRIREPGFSFHGRLPDFKRIVDGYPWTFCQIQYNFLDEAYQAGTEGLKYAASRNLGVIIMEPLRGGNLGLAEAPGDIKAVWDAASTRRTPAEWALRWVWNHPEVTVVLSGMNEESHIEENLAIAADARPNALSDEELALVKQAGDKYKELMQVNCTGCGYCTPCPSNVNIPGCFDVYNKLYMFKNEQEAKILYAIRMSGVISGEAAGYASECVECGECLEKCPQSIPIPDVLKKVAAEMEGPDLPERVQMAKKMLNID